MANQLAMDKVLAIQGLASQGFSERRIAETLGISRKAVRRHLGRSDAKETKAPVGEAPTGSDGSKETEAPTGSADPQEVASGAGSTAAEKPSRSLCQPFAAIILEKLERGLTAERIHQDLCQEHGFTARYSSVRRFVHELGQRTSPPFRRMEVEPGSEAQIDYGAGPRCGGADGQATRTHVFRIVLSYSRKGYSEAVRRLTTESLIRSLENAFRALGGVPAVVVFDNARSAVQQADWYDPELNPKLADFCRHYGFTLLPTRPYTPRHKGKIERGIGYVKDNALRGRSFASLAELNSHLTDWERRVADTRIHGTTKQHVGRLFEEVERGALGPLPAAPFPYFEEGRRRVTRDGHVEVKRAFYSAPPEYVGRDVWVRWNEQTVRILNHRFEQIALHCRQSAGKYSTQGVHLDSRKISVVERGAEYLLGKAAEIGPQAQRWAERVLALHGVRGMRILQGLLALRRKHAAAAVEGACEAAWRSQGFRYRILKRLLERPQSEQQEMLPFMESHPVIRPLCEYGEFVSASIRGTSHQGGETDVRGSAIDAPQAAPVGAGGVAGDSSARGGDERTEPS